MEITPILTSAAWAGFYASGAGMLFTVGLRYLAYVFVCGFAGRLARDLLMGADLSQNWSTVLAAAVVALVGMTAMRRHPAPLVLLASSLLPLAAAVPIFNSIVGVMKVSALKGEPLAAASVALSANVAKFFTTTLAIAVGLAAGIVLFRLLGRSKEVEV